MKTDGAPHPVELLRDQHGVYGIGVSDLFDFESVAWSCGIEPEPYTFERPFFYTLRKTGDAPDVIGEGKAQRITDAADARWLKRQEAKAQKSAAEQMSFLPKRKRGHQSAEADAE
jgi:hypothetical protein